jgi:hypothetical protein
MPALSLRIEPILIIVPSFAILFSFWQIFKLKIKKTTAATQAFSAYFRYWFHPQRARTDH